LSIEGETGIMKYYVPDVFRRNPMKRQMIMAGIAAFVTVAAVSLVAQTAPAGQAPAAPPKKAAAPTPASCGPTPPAELKYAAQGSRCFEMRTYAFNPAGGNGNLEVFRDRFRTLANGLFKKHNMTIVGAWVPVAKADTIVYILAFKDAAARDAAWAAFQADPDWTKLRTDMNVSQTVVQEFMVATDYSAIK
jgi:hypothetical protein